MIRLLVCDGDGTLGLPNPTPEHIAMIEGLAAMGIPYAVASNGEPKEGDFTRAGFPAPIVIATPSVVGAKKASPLFIEYISKQTGFSAQEMVFLGDDDNTDTFCAMNAGVIPLAASYSSAKKPRKYGLQIKSPNAVKVWIEVFGQCPEPHFGWTINSSASYTSDARSLGPVT